MVDRFKMPVMAHLVLGYPTLPESIRTADIYVQAGVEILELQIPFSHPTADGPVITAACQEAVERQQVTMADCLEAIRTIRQRYPEQEIMVMSYLNRVFTYGLKEFADAMAASGVRHLIVPDLPADSEVAATLVRNHKIGLVPVLAANASDARLEKLLGMGFDFFYLMSDFKITGSEFSLNPRLQQVIAQIKQPTTSNQQPRVGIGFGIRTPEQARQVTEEADVAIIGSALIQAQQAGRLEEFLEDLKEGFKTSLTTDCSS